MKPQLLETLKFRIKPFVESNIYLQSLGMSLLRRMPMLLPHDTDYHGLKFLTQKKSKGIFLEVGANVGLSALSFRKFDRTTRILSLEPNPIHFAALSKLKKADPFFDFKMVAVGHERAKMTLFVPFVGKLALHTKASLSRAALEQACDQVLSSRNKARLVIKSFEVEVIRIDDLNVVPAILKMDIEGHEKSALRGAMLTIERCRPALMVEYSPTSFASARDLLADLNYRLLYYDHRHDSFTSEPLPARNVFFIPGERVDDLPTRTKAPVSMAIG